MSVYDNNHKGNANENEVNTRSSSLSRTNFQASTFNMDRELSNFDALSRQPSLDLVGRQLSTDFPLKLNSQSLDIDDFMKSDLCSSFSNYLVPLGPEKTGSTVPNPPFLHDVSSQDRQLGFLQRSQMLSRLNGGSSNHARRSSDVFNFGSNEFSMMNMNATCNNAIAWQRYQNFLQQPNSGQMSSDYHPSSLEASHYNRHMRSSENMGFGMGGGGMGMMTPSQNAFSHSDFARGGTITPESSTKVARNESNSKDILSPQIETPIKTLSSTEANLSDGTELVHNVTPDTRSKNAHDNISLSSTQGTETKRFKPFHEEKWNIHLEELIEFKRKNGHCLVPHTYPPNPHLARWVKRQRRQYKLKMRGEGHSTMTQERIDILNREKFTWDSHEAVWKEKFSELVKYKHKNGNCRVPSCSKEYPQLATWVKCQRRQYKLFWEGKRSSMTADRTQLLEDIGFSWEVRSNTSIREQKKTKAMDYSHLVNVIQDL